MDVNVIDKFRLDGRVVLVTGAKRGLGKAFARALGEVGARVAISSREEADGQLAAAELRGDGLDVIAVTGDVKSYADVEHMVSQVESELGPIDVLVNNAGICEHLPALEVTPASWREVLAVNLDGLWFCSQVVGRSMVERRRGVIVNIGSISGIIVNRPQWQPAYNASKAAVHQLSRSLAGEWAAVRHPRQRPGPRLRVHGHVAGARGAGSPAKMGRRRTYATYGNARRSCPRRRLPGQ